MQTSALHRRCEGHRLRPCSPCCALVNSRDVIRVGLHGSSRITIPGIKIIAVGEEV